MPKLSEDGETTHLRGTHTPPERLYQLARYPLCNIVVELSPIAGAQHPLLALVAQLEPSHHNA